MVDEHYTRGLSEFVAGLAFEDLPTDVGERMQLLVLDTIGAGLLGAAMPWSVRMRNTVQQMEAPGHAPVWGLSCASPRRQLPFSTARLCTASRLTTWEPWAQRVGHADIHPGTCSAPWWYFRSGHHHRHDGRNIEVGSRVGRCVGGIPHAGMGFHGPGPTGTFASAGASANTLRLTTDQCVDTLGHAGQQAASLMFTHHGWHGQADAGRTSGSCWCLRCIAGEQWVYECSKCVRGGVRRVSGGSTPATGAGPHMILRSLLRVLVAIGSRAE